MARGTIVSCANSTPFRDPWLVLEERLPFPVHSLRQSGFPKPTVDYFYTGRAVVLGRVPTTLRSVETQAFPLGDLSCQIDKSLETKCLKELFIFFGTLF